MSRIIGVRSWEERPFPIEARLPGGRVRLEIQVFPEGVVTRAVLEKAVREALLVALDTFREPFSFRKRG